ncbi:MAG TPA: hypothetical protein VE546_04695 [Streptomyces sp.]|uniref:hypothetical protein n=1 Tax=Streptomyces sp. TaxID=1931 RepID=UPI002D2E7A3B|nr:hypothetical protein [Streptomyces sp.]HZG02861.1 hypothetical protein [Streptomyces sp.]
MRRITTALGSLATATLMALAVPHSATAAQGLLIIGNTSFQNPSGCYGLQGDRGHRQGDHRGVVLGDLREGALEDAGTSENTEIPESADLPGSTENLDDGGRGGDGGRDRDRGRDRGWTLVGNFTNRTALVFSDDYCTGYLIDEVRPREQTEIRGESLFIR